MKAATWGVQGRVRAVRVGAGAEEGRLHGDDFFPISSRTGAVRVGAAAAGGGSMEMTFSSISIGPPLLAALEKVGS